MRTFKRHFTKSVTLAAILFIALVAMNSRRSSAPPETPIDIYEKSWEHKALKIQNSIDIDAPLKDALMIHSHNAYNASAYKTAFSYLDPNHVYSLKDQLRMDVRVLELDVHWYFSMDGWPWEWKNTTLLCHGQSNHLGCSSYDRHLSKGIDEINSWIRSNRDQVVHIYLEEHLNGHLSEALSVITSRLGDLIYRTGTTSCKGMDVNLTKRQVLNAGKNIVIFASGGCQSNGDWNSWIHTYSNIKQNPSKDITYPACGGVSRDTYKNNIIRFFEDGTVLGGLFGDGRWIYASNMDDLVNCGANYPGVDQLTPTDGRLAAAIWSFSSGEPNDWGGNEDCIHQWGNGKWNDNNCSVSYRFACRNSSGDWYVTNGSGPWTSGFNQCSSEKSGYEFATPRNGYENKVLEAAKKAKGQSNVWLRYNDRASEGNYTN